MSKRNFGLNKSKICSSNCITKKVTDGHKLQKFWEGKLFFTYRSDNAVKNHYHSKLRKGIRRINHRINAFLKGQHKFLRNNIISKIVQTAEKIYLQD